jgi:hypothetical protein
MFLRVLLACYGLAGALLIAYGLYQWWEPAAYIFAGVFIVADSWLSGRAANPKPKEQKRNA